MLSCSPAWASSHFWFGVILEVAPGKDGVVTVNALYLAYGYRPQAGHTIQRMTVNADVPVYLDWKRSTAVEALQAGRTFVFFTNHKHILDKEGKPMSAPYSGSRQGGALLVSTAPCPMRPAALGAPECNLLIADMDKPGNLAALLPAPLEKGVSGARLVLALEKDRIASGFIWTPQLQGGAWHETDVSRLKFDKGALDGEIAVKYAVANGKTAAATYSLKSDAKGSGAFTGSLGEEKVAGKLSVMGLGAVRPEKDAQLWLYTKDPRFRPAAGDAGWHYLVCGFSGEKSGAGWLCHEKGFASGALADTTMTLAEGGMAGAFSATVLKPKEGDKGVKVAVEGRVLAGHFVTARLTFDEGGKAATAPAVGFLMRPDVAPLVQPGSEKGAH
jgi:hypothetical protein